MEELPRWAELLFNYGFPVTIGIYLLFRFERRIDSLTMAIMNLAVSNQNQKRR
ncbi:YvrJ family protein [Oceanobacillus manasiensis]|uniref:YvrJ family protein n=1 Tax=Oceanobacillus manasiensis TaxID=586413 RepID=UPI000A00EDDC|nr:YvrJ family protein [Oceanobacillus manasiensis]